VKFIGYKSYRARLAATRIFLNKSWQNSVLYLSEFPDPSQRTTKLTRSYEVLYNDCCPVLFCRPGNWSKSWHGIHSIGDWQPPLHPGEPQAYQQVKGVPTLMGQTGIRGGSCNPSYWEVGIWGWFGVGWLNVGLLISHECPHWVAWSYNADQIQIPTA
jgi:hypothetical protein